MSEDRPPEESTTPAPLLAPQHFREVAAHRRILTEKLRFVTLTPDEADAVADALDERDRLLNFVTKGWAAESAIDSFLEFRDLYGDDEQTARAKALNEVADGVREWLIAPGLDNPHSNRPTESSR